MTHYCVTNMPALAPRTSTFALTNATAPYLEKLASKGAEQALREDDALLRGLNVYRGAVVNEAVAESQGLNWRPAFS